jgi:hypothetical protein
MMTRPERYFIGPSMKNKLSEIISRAENTSLGGGADEIPVRLTGMQRSVGSEDGAAVSEATFMGGWVKGQFKQVTFVADTTATAMAINLIRTIPVASGGLTARLCTVTERSVQDSGTTEKKFVLINSEC